MRIGAKPICRNQYAVVMKVFISWSGDKSRKVAEALSEWIPDVIQEVDCFFSSETIRAGQQWLQVINAQLAETSFGILCVTADNQEARWLNFEAGALAKKIDDDTRVVPLTFDFQPSSLEYPIRQFNGVNSSRDGILGMMKSISETAKGPRNDAAFDRAFAKWWPELEAKFKEIERASEPVQEPAPPNMEALVQEILGIVRSLAQPQKRDSGTVSSGSQTLLAAAGIDQNFAPRSFDFVLKPADSSTGTKWDLVREAQDLIAAAERSHRDAGQNVAE
ncbi:TIR domain-containing protein [Cryobacterium frigoriphilum]|uniref:TIR domain-containing protein n=2 Tax=Cryobacterium frigoriphilum TaxID=1259150 RepID=A0A4R9A1X4_9MICO|nr:TIR domain-containing protein [Cryobacterium frigoriphilum]